MAALKGIRVIDLSRVLGGPFAGQLLADHGAEVIKIEPPQGDETRDWGPPFTAQASAYFAGCNRGKRALSLDLSKAKGQEVLRRLLQNADVLIENFRHGCMENWGLDHQSLHKEFPRLIYCRVSGFGDSGPLAGLPGYDAAVQAWSGLMSVNGDPKTGPARLGVPLVDLGTGMNAAFGILLAVLERARTGVGQKVEVSLYATALSLAHPHLANHFAGAAVPGPSGSAHTNIAPYDLFQCQDGALFLAVGNDAQFAKLVEHLGVPQLALDPRFLKNSDRLQNRDELKKQLESRLARFCKGKLAEDLLHKGVPCGPVQSFQEVAAHAQTAGSRVDLPGYQGIASPVQLSDSPAQYTLAPPAFAADSDEVLRQAGFTATEINELKMAEVVFTQRHSRT